ncbi:MAG: GNAT family N-acetyltransferase [Clostridia bacterium]|nr:GNAT family N-acetyltransferase [Clostridia bacterium]
MSFPLKKIPRDLLDPWFDKFEKIYLVPAYPRHSKKWSRSFGFESIYLGFDKYAFSQVVPQNTEELYLFYLYVSPENRREGYGTKLMKEIIQVAIELGYKRISLDVGYLNPKDRVPVKVLRSFYKSLGFVNYKGPRMILHLTEGDRIAA